MYNLLGAILAGLLLLFGSLTEPQVSSSTTPASNLNPAPSPGLQPRALTASDLFSFLSLPFEVIESRQSLNGATGERESEGEPVPHQLPIEINKEQVYLEASKAVDYLPVRNWNVPFAEISAKAVLSADEKAEKFFYEKNSSERLPIASLTKLMTALVALDNYQLEENVKVSKIAVQTEGEMGGLVVGEALTVRSILYLMLMESSNDAAVALAEQIGSEQFVELMNKKAAELGLNNTRFSNPVGFDGAQNYSTAFDLARLTSAALNYPLVWEILRTQEIDIRSEPSSALSQAEGKIFNHHAVNSNKLLNVLPEMIGGKTGYTDLAGGCMIVVVQFGAFKVINVLLGANGGVPYLDRFKETEKLINWLKQAYSWKNF